MERTVFNQAQLELLNAMAALNTQEELFALKQAISEFFARRADEEMDRLWEQGVLTEQKFHELKKQHLRTPYNR